ncbi:hypothetical protein ACOI22_09680 [Glaciecola sp. 2405UD65-10]|uniref:hypothetical protein n=1 Tax=Glaciecola sp. 2405UD65-10 TaxID=3397244 RepID=UPI003B5A3A49
MSKSPLARYSKTVKHVRNGKDIFPLNLSIPFHDGRKRKVEKLDLSHLLYFGADINNRKISSRAPYIRKYCKKANEYFENGNSVRSIASSYDNLRAFIVFCDTMSISPLSEAGYLKYVGNDGELRHRIRMYRPSKKLWEMEHGDEIGIKESTAGTIASQLRTALSWCGLPAESWKNQHRGFACEKQPLKGYSEAEEEILVTRLSELFFTLAPQLIAAKKDNIDLPIELPVVIDLAGYKQVISIHTSNKIQLYTPSKNGKIVRANSAFNMVMGAAYHLVCFYTSLNDSDIRSIGHPIKVHTEDRDKKLKVIKVSSFKRRANKKVDALFTNQSFDVDKKDGVRFIRTLEKLSSLYGGGEKGSTLLFTINDHGEENSSFNLVELNKHLCVDLNLLSPNRLSCVPWLQELFYSYRNQCTIELGKVINELGRMVVSKVTRPCSKFGANRGARESAYCILSCYTDLPLKGILLPLKYSPIDKDGNIKVSFEYRNGDHNHFLIPASDKRLIKDIEQFSTELADKQSKKYERLLLKRGGSKQPVKDWEGISPIRAQRPKGWSLGPNEYYISLHSSRWREMTSNQVFSHGGTIAVQSTLQNLLRTIDKHYANGDPRLNKIILSQAVQVIGKLDASANLELAKKSVAAKLGIAMLTHDEWKKKQEQEKAKTNPNGVHCNGQQSFLNGKSTQRETNNAMRLQLPCSEYDMCYKCESAKAVDDTQSIYKLISFVDVLKETVNLFPEARDDVHEKIAAFESTLDAASPDVYEAAISLFNKNGRHQRVTSQHAILSLNHSQALSIRSDS